MGRMQCPLCGGTKLCRIVGGGLAAAPDCCVRSVIMGLFIPC